MSLIVSADPLPLVTDVDGVIRVGRTRVPLDTVVVVFDLGASPEEIVQQFPSLELADVYAVVGYYLRHRDEVGAYMRERQERGTATRQATELRYDAARIRTRLLQRRTRHE